ncbi:MAG: glycosyltransferase family 9 protein [Chitinivibrionales bacterium]|nr:glycosyltransferase family 9 protein [Chitinivibrionales bacterium]
MKVLCVCPIGVGNYLLTYPACKLIKEAAPDIALHLLGLRSYIRDLAQGDSLWSGVHIFDPTAQPLIGLASIAAVAALRREHFDASLNFFASNKWQYNLLPLLCGIPARHGFVYQAKSARSLAWLCNHHLSVDVTAHDIEQNIALANSFLGQKKAGVAAQFPALFTTEDKAWAEGFYAAQGGPAVRIGVHGGSSVEHGMQAKQWAPERFGELADTLARELKGRVFVFGGKEEQSLKNSVVAAMRQKPVVVAPVDRKKTAALLAQCTLFLGNDSGLMHIAACQDVPTIAIFGPTDEKRNGPRGKHTLVVRKQMAGFPLWTAANVGGRRLRRGVDAQASLKALDVEDAWRQIGPWLKELGIGKS